MKKHLTEYTKEVNKSIALIFLVGLGTWLIVSSLTEILSVKNPFISLLFGAILVMAGVYFQLKNGGEVEKND